MTGVPRGRLVGWAVLVAVLAGIAYAGRIAEGAPDDNLLYKYGTAVGAVVQFAIIGGVLLAIARGLSIRQVLALRRPASWGRALGYAALALVAVYVVGYALSPFLDAGKDQGLVPDRWEPAHAGAYAANFVVIVLVAPLVEETLYRGFGMGAIGPRLGTPAAVVVTAVCWGLAHGLGAGLPVLVAFGIILGSVRARTGSVLPGMLTHAVFNAVSLVLAVTVAAT